MCPVFIDTHCHFDFPPFTTHEQESLTLAAQSGVERIIVPAVSAEMFDGILSLSRQFSMVYAALGLHPLYVAVHHQDSLDRLEQLLKGNAVKLVAVGEIGLDEYMDEPLIERQQWLLSEQLTFAKRYELPVILHSRRTHDRLAKVLRQSDLPRTGVVHGFSGSLEQAKAFVRLGYRIGVGGVITYPRAQKTRNVMAALPLSALVLETDAPDMPLSGFQGQPNRPERVKQVFEQLCLLRTEPAQQIAEQLYTNSMELFWPA
ncbi:TatD family hydrolase [Budvicia aquatica]|uniref:TatD family hydrolase n=1 Tax=Budvicia aquatica TaxID=82979 RepID=UPI001B55388D|nr:TatD family hydrolase [Budvicia aquatica]MBP9642313.1 TatD family hydrolase [Budvicia sp.]GKX50263.1 putative metal-dependent hydrolase YjjV [Budvicia aquatica]